jgi:hypothetical protein
LRVARRGVFRVAVTAGNESAPEFFGRQDGLVFPASESGPALGGVACHSRGFFAADDIDDEAIDEYDSGVRISKFNTGLSRPGSTIDYIVVTVTGF